MGFTKIHALGIAPLSSACSAEGPVTNSAELSSVLLSGQMGDITVPDTQTETIVSVQQFGCSPSPCTPPPPVITVTDNDETTEEALGYIVYTSTDRFIYRGASYMGWQVSDDGIPTFRYGAAAGKPRPPTGWSVLWGDPALTSSRTDQRYAFISNLAVPDSKFPSAGYIQGPINNYLGGACIGRSVDAGRTFTLSALSASASDCVNFNSHFYDGGSMESDLSGQVYASWVDWTANQIDVWRATSLTGAFSPLPTQPFPGKTVQSHPRLMFEPITGRLYVMAQASDASHPTFECGSSGGNVETCAALWLAYLDPRTQAWQPPVVVATDCLYMAFIAPQPGSRLFRTHPQFSFATSQASINGDDGIRVAYTTKVSGRHVIHAVRCGNAADPWALNCTATPEWGGDFYAGEQWSPLVRAQYGFGPVLSEFMLSYSTTAQSEVPWGVGWTYGRMMVGGGGIRSYIETVAYKNYQICPDTRGYWGDYDDMQVLYAGNQSGFSTYIRTHTDSSSGACAQQMYSAKPQHITAIVLP